MTKHRKAKTKECECGDLCTPNPLFRGPYPSHSHDIGFEELEKRITLFPELVEALKTIIPMLKLATYPKEKNSPLIKRMETLLSKCEEMK